MTSTSLQSLCKQLHITMTENETSYTFSRSGLSTHFRKDHIDTLDPRVAAAGIHAEVQRLEHQRKEREMLDFAIMMHHTN